MKNTTVFDLKYIEFQHTCPHLKTNIERYFKDYFILKDNFHRLINFCLYKKLAKSAISSKRIISKWKRMLSMNLYKKYINLKFLQYITNFLGFYNTAYNIKCISTPLHIDINNIQVQGYIDLIIKNNNQYQLYIFIVEEIAEKINMYNKILPGVVALSFFNDFHETNFDIIIYNLATNKEFKIKNPWQKIDFYTRQSRSLICTKKDCQICLFRMNCNYAEKN